MNQDNFDDEFARAFAEIKELRGTVATLREQVESLEKRELLRVRDSKYCRVCNQQMTPTTNPPISESEQKYHDAKHAIAAPGFDSTSNWDEVEKRAAHYKKPH